MSNFITCLKKLGENNRCKDKIVPLEGNNEIVIGRGEDVAVRLNHSMISRKHAVFKKTENNQWAVIDNQTINGTYVNDERVTPCLPHVVHDGDVIRFGVRPKPSEPTFSYQFYSSLKVRLLTRQTPNDDKKRKLFNPSNQTEIEQKRIKNTEFYKQETQEKIVLTQVEKIEQEKDRRLNELRLEKEKVVKEMEERSKQQLLDAQAQVSALKELLEEKDLVQAQMAQEMKDQEELMMQAKIEQEKKMEQEKQKIEREMQESIDRQLMEKEESLKQQITCQKLKLLDEKNNIEEKLKIEMERKLEEKDKSLESELVKQKEKLNKIIANKELEQRFLESQLNDTKVENEKTKEQMQKVREDVLNSFTDAIENELQCSICTELFVQATTLNCTHSFCSYCINVWMAKKQECPLCPLCRNQITSNIRSIALDNYIDKMSEQLSDEMKRTRTELVKSRKELDQKSGKTDKAKTGTPAATRGPRGRPAQAAPIDTIVIHDDGSSSDSSDEDDDSEDSSSNEDSDDSNSDEGIDGAYFGGYGHCFRCGSHGHWANGCPYR